MQESIKSMGAVGSELRASQKRAKKADGRKLVGRKNVVDVQFVRSQYEIFNF